MKRTTIMADEELLFRIERLARRQGRTKAEMIRDALELYVADQEAELPLASPLMNLVGLAGPDAPPMDLADGRDEELIRDSLHPHFGFTRADDATSG
ncbi:MAG: CopG family transcriptional regulator [Caldilineaceae bacterium]|nr:CopG family transcriptional regulator [Caldilineaceae bacterium]